MIINFYLACILERDEYKIPNPNRRDNRWEGEDEADVKDNWDDDNEDENEEEEKVQKPVVNVEKKKKLSARLAKLEEKQRAELEAKKLKAEAETVKTPSEILSDKLEKQRLQEEADLNLAKEAFGISEAVSDLNLANKENLDQFSKSLISKFQSLEKSPLYVTFLEKFFRDLCVNLDVADIKRLANNLNALYNEKFKAQKVSINLSLNLPS